MPENGECVQVGAKAVGGTDATRHRQRERPGSKCWSGRVESRIEPWFDALKFDQLHAISFCVRGQGSIQRGKLVGPELQGNGEV